MRRFRIPFDGKSSAMVDIRDTTSGPSAPNLEIIWFPVAVLDVPTPTDVHGVSIVGLLFFTNSALVLTSNPLLGFDHGCFWECRGHN